MEAAVAAEAAEAAPTAKPYPEVSPPVVVKATANATATIIWLHGLGDEAIGWKQLAEKVAVPWVNYVIPRAPVQTVDLMDMDTNAWYNVAGVSVKELRSDVDGIRGSYAYVHKLIEEEIASGIPSERIIVGGFSQGGCIALAAALSCKHQLGGVIAMSTWYPRRVVDEPTEANSKLPVMLCHGEVDPIAKVEWAQKSFEYMSVELGLPVNGLTYSEIGHEFKPSVVTDIREFVNKVAPPVYKVTLAKPLGAVMSETDGPVQVKELKEGGNAEASGKMMVGDQIMRVNGKLVKTAGFEATMAELVAAEGDIVLDMARPFPDRDILFDSLSEAEQKVRYQSSGVIKVCSDGPCTRQGAKNVLRWIKELTPAEFSVSKVGCTGNCGNGPNVVVAGKGKEESVLYGRNSVGLVVKMLQEEYDIETDANKVQQLLNPGKDAKFGARDELVRQAILASIEVKGSYETNRF